MSWQNALNSSQWILLAIIPPAIVLLYFLKLRRKPVEVPSTYLWKRTIEDLHVNSLWQRLRNSLLLILQLLLVCLLMVACLGPGCDGEELQGDRFIFLIDQSASMSATDAGESRDRTRLDEAKTQAENLIRRMEPDDVAMIIASSDRSNVVQSYTKNQTLLLKKLKAIKPTQRSTDLEEALVAATGLATPGRISTESIDVQVAETLDARLFIFTDGGVAELPDVALGSNMQTQYVPIGSPEPEKNLGIVEFSLSNPLESEGKVVAYVQIQNSDDEDHQTSVSLYVDGELFDTQADIPIRSRDTSGLSFDLTALAVDIESPIQLKVELETEDIFEIDNTAFEVLNPPRKSQILVITESNRFLELATDTDRISKMATVEFQPSQYVEDEEFKKNAALGGYDLIIFDGCAPKLAPMCHTAYINALPPGSKWKFGEKTSPSPVLDTSQTHPLMYGVSLNSVLIIDSRPITGPSGSVSLVESIRGSIMAIGPRGGFQDLVVGFPLLEFHDEGDVVPNTDWPKKLGFPLFIQNLVFSLGNSSYQSMGSQQPGSIVEIRSQIPLPEVQITSPDGDQKTLKARGDNSFSYADANQIGIYDVIEPTTDQLTQQFAINLLDRRESDLKVRDELNIGFSEIKGERNQKRPVRKEFWPWLVGVALIVLSVEWFIYNRRVFI